LFLEEEPHKATDNFTTRKEGKGETVIKDNKKIAIR
jgi:hypothetical protein